MNSDNKKTRSFRRKRNRKEGSVMMEFVILAVLIAVAVTAGVQVLGGAISSQVKAASEAVVQDSETAANTVTTTRGEILGDAETADQTARAVQGTGGN